ncbi:MAG: ATP-binding cassette domain-containing protein [Myxococcota bacterium]
MLALHSASRHFEGCEALAPTDLTFPEGQISVLLGPSGCGKSTLLRLLIGLISPSAGRVTFDGAEVTPGSAPLLRRRMGFVIQEGGLFPHLTAERNVSLMARHLGWDNGRVRARVDALADLTHFPADGFARYPAQLSGGQRQRVSLMRALMLDPDVLLLDEPLGALDPMIRAGLQADLREIFRALRKTVVMVTHDIGEAGFFSDAIVLMRAGRIVQRGTLADLVRNPAEPFVSDFINAQRSPLDATAGNPE